MNDYSNSQLSRSNPLLTALQPASSAPLGLSSASRLPAASNSTVRSVPGGGMSSSSLSIPSSLASPLGLSSSAALPRPAGLSGLSALSGSSPPLSSLHSHSQHMSALNSRQGVSGGSGAGGGLLGSLSGLGGLPVNGGLFGGVLSPQSFSPDMALLLSSHSSPAAVGGGSSGAGGKPAAASQTAHSHSHSHPLSGGLAGLSALGHLGGQHATLPPHQQQQQLDNSNGGLLDRDSIIGSRDRERERERERERQSGPRFDMSDFPSLSEVVGGGGAAKDGLAVGMGLSNSHSTVGLSSAAGGTNMASLLSASSQGGLHLPSEFSMQTEEFPALSAAVSRATQTVNTHSPHTSHQPSC